MRPHTHPPSADETVHPTTSPPAKPAPGARGGHGPPTVPRLSLAGPQASPLGASSSPRVGGRGAGAPRTEAPRHREPTGPPSTSLRSRRLSANDQPAESPCHRRPKVDMDTIRRDLDAIGISPREVRVARAQLPGGNAHAKWTVGHYGGTAESPRTQEQASLAAGSFRSSGVYRSRFLAARASGEKAGPESHSPALHAWSFHSAQDALDRRAALQAWEAAQQAEGVGRVTHDDGSILG